MGSSSSAPAPPGARDSPRKAPRQAQGSAGRAKPPFYFDEIIRGCGLGGPWFCSIAPVLGPVWPGPQGSLQNRGTPFLTGLLGYFLEPHLPRPRLLASFYLTDRIPRPAGRTGRGGGQLPLPPQRPVEQASEVSFWEMSPLPYFWVVDLGMRRERLHCVC